MRWVEIAQFELSQAWQWTAPIAGQMFRIRHLTQTPNTRGLITQALFVGGKLQLFESQRFEPRIEEELIIFQVPDELLDERRIAAKLSSSSTASWTVAIDVLELDDEQSEEDIFALYIAAHKADLDPHPQYVSAAELDAALQGKEDSGTAIDLIIAHEQSTNPHGQYLQADDIETLLLPLEDAIDAKEAQGVAMALFTEHAEDSDPHPQYATDTALSEAVATLESAIATKEALGSAIAMLAAHLGAIDPHSEYATDTALAQAIADHEALDNSHPKSALFLSLTTPANSATFYEVTNPQRLVLKNNCFYAGNLWIIGKQVGASSSQYWNHDFAARRGNNASTTAIVWNSASRRYGDTTSFAYELFADTTNGAIGIRCRSGATQSTGTNWKIYARLVEVSS